MLIGTGLRFGLWMVSVFLTGWDFSWFVGYLTIEYEKKEKRGRRRLAEGLLAFH